MQGEKQTTTITQQSAQEKSLLDTLIDESRIARAPEEKARARDILGEFVDQLLDKSMIVNGNVETAIGARIAEIDQLISEQLNEVLHAEPFQKLEASWRGLHKLVQETETGERMKIRVFNTSKQDLLKDLQRAAEFDQSALFKKIYEAEYGTFGGAPFGLLVGDYEFDRSPGDVEFLEKVSNIAASAHAPFVSAAAPGLLNLESWTELEKPRDLAKIFSGPEYAQWRAFRESEDSRYVALVMPHYLSRLPYGQATVPVSEFAYEEDVDGTDHQKYLWGNASYLYALRMTDAFSKYGWCTAIRGVEGGGLVENLPIHTFRTEDGEVAAKVPTETEITDRREKELSDLGMISLVYSKGSNYAAFFSGQTVNKAKKFVDADANANAELSARLPYLMATCRIAHYLKSIVRDKIGGFSTREGIQKYLTGWINQYILLDDNASQSAKAERPLRDAQIRVEEIPGRPGSYRAVAHLRPHFQLESMAVSLRLVANLPKSAG